MASLQEPDDGIGMDVRSAEADTRKYFVPPHVFIPSRSLVERPHAALVLRDTFSTSTSSATNPGSTCPPNSTDPICAKPVTANTFTLPIALGVTIPVVGAIIAFYFLHRRHKRKLREEDADVRNASLDFGLGNSPPGRNGRRPLNMDDEFDMKEKPNARGRGLSLDMTNPYLLPPELQNSRESLRSLSRNLHNAEDPYRPVSELIADSHSPRYSHRDGGSSIYTGSSGAPSRLYDSSTADLLSNARGMSKSPVHRVRSVQPQNSLAPLDSRQHLLPTSSSPRPISPVEPAYTRDQVSGTQRKGVPNQSQTLALPKSDESVRESYMGNESTAIRLSNNYLGQYIHGRAPGLVKTAPPPPRKQTPDPLVKNEPLARERSPSPPPPPPVPKLSVEAPIVRIPASVTNSLPANPRPPRQSHEATHIQTVEPEHSLVEPERQKPDDEQQKGDYEHEQVDSERPQINYEHQPMEPQQVQLDGEHQRIESQHGQIEYRRQKPDYVHQTIDYEQQQLEPHHLRKGYENQLEEPAQQEREYEHQQVEPVQHQREYEHRHVEPVQHQREYEHRHVETVHEHVEQNNWDDDASDYGDNFQITSPSPPLDNSHMDNGNHNSGNDRYSRRYSMDVPPEEFANAGLGAPGFDARRISMSFRPLPPSTVVDSDDPEVRANRIRSFYKEYFDESRPAPKGQYYEDYDSGYTGSAYQDPYQNNYYDAHQPMPYEQHYAQPFAQPYAQPMTRRAMTPPPGAGRYMGQAPRAFHGSLAHMNGRPMVPNDYERPHSSQSGRMMPQHDRPYSSMSGRRGPIGPPRGRLRPPPQALNTLPTPSKLRDDSFALMNATDFAPPASYRERAKGRSESPLGERRPYSPGVPAFKPLTSAFEELPAMPSPHHLRKSGTFTGLDFAPPRKIFRGDDTKSDSGSIRSNGSAASARQLYAIRSGAYRVSRIPNDQVFTQAELATVLKPTWDQRAATPSFG